MFDFFQAVFAKVASFVVGVIMATGLVSPPTAQTQATSTEPVAQIEIQEESATTTELVSEVESLKKEAEQARTEAAAERLKTEKAKADAAAARAESEQQRLQTERQQLQAENDRLKAEAAATTQAAAAAQAARGKEANQGVYCNGKYWAQCPAGQEFRCPASGNATCVPPISSADLSRAANNKAEMIELANKLINVQKEIEELIIYELSFVNETINKLTGHNDESTNILRQISILYRDFLISSKNTVADQISNGEGIKSAAQTMRVEDFLNEQAVMSRKEKMYTLLDSNTMSSLQQAAARYRDDIRQWLQY